MEVALIVGRAVLGSLLPTYRKQAKNDGGISGKAQIRLCLPKGASGSKPE
jgi:hypothetical protein